MAIWHQLLACAFVVFCIVRGEVEDIKADSDSSSIDANEVNLERDFGHFTGENYQFDEANQAKAIITQLRRKRENSPSYNREHSEYLEKVNTASERNTPSRNEENFIQVPNKGGRLENIKKEHLSSHTHVGKAVHYNSQEESYDRRNSRRGYKSVLDPSSGYHIISEREKNYNDESNEEPDEIVMYKNNTDSDYYRSQAEDIKNINMNSQSNQGRQTSPNVDINTEEVRYAAQKKPLSHDSIYLVNSNHRRRIEPAVESSGLKDTVSNVDDDYVRQTESVPEGSSYAYEAVKRNQMLLPMQTKDQGYNAYQQHEPQNNFDRRLVNLEIENKDSSDQRYVEGEYVKHPNEESTHFESKKEYEIPQGGHNEKNKFVNVALEYADHQAFSQGYRTKQHLPKEGIESNEHEERTTTSHAAQPLQTQNLKHKSQQLQYNIREDGIQLQNNGYEQINVPIGTSYHQTDDKSEEKIPIHNLGYVPQQVHKYFLNQGNNAETQKQPTTVSGYYEQLIHNYDHELPLPSKTPVNQNRPQSSHIVPKEIFEVANDEINFQYGATQTGNKHLEDYNLPQLHNSPPLDNSQQQSEPEKQNIYGSDASKSNSPHGIFFARASKYAIK